LHPFDAGRATREYTLDLAAAAAAIAAAAATFSANAACPAALAAFSVWPTEPSRAPAFQSFTAYCAPTAEASALASTIPAKAKPDTGFATRPASPSLTNAWASAQRWSHNVGPWQVRYA